MPDKGVTFRSSPAGDVPSSGGAVVSIHEADPAVLRANATNKIGFPLATFLPGLQNLGAESIFRPRKTMSSFFL